MYVNKCRNFFFFVVDLELCNTHRYNIFSYINKGFFMVSGVFSLIAGAISICAGLFLVSTRAAGSNSMIEVLAHGMGWYFVARGVYMLGPAKGLTASMRSFFKLHAEENMRCSVCYGVVHAEATKCRHCGSDAKPKAAQ
jgi:ribosomal protein L40E